MKTSNKGFTLFEALIAISVGVTMLGLVLSIYVLTIRSLGAGENRSELTQNSRVIIERLTRDLREGKDIATVLPQTDDDIEHPPPSQIEIQDGHGDQLQYIKYYTSDTNLRRQIRQYSFSSESDVLVTFDAEDDFGNPPDLNIISDNIIGQYVDLIKFYGMSRITVELTLKKGTITHNTKTSVYGRNL